MPGTDIYIRNQDYARQLAAKQAAAPAATAKSEDSGFGFGDLLDIINPLQHIPVVSTIYRHLTGDKIGLGEKIAGDTLYGGLTGFLCSVGDAVFTEATGKSFGDTVYAALFGEDGQPATAVAANDTAAAPADAAPTADGNAPDTTAIGLMDLPPAQVTAGQAAAAYRASGRLLAAY